MKTRILKVPPGPEPGHFVSSSSSSSANPLDTWAISTSPSAQATLAPLHEAARLLRESDIPVAFPTETVYGLGADATRSTAVKGIYAAKGRPSDNPLIVHVCDLAMLRGLLRPKEEKQQQKHHDDTATEEEIIPEIYRELVKRFWPGPLTILLRSPVPGSLAPEVTAGLPTFGARMPASPLARTLIRLADAPLAAPSANASTKPSPTAASHVLDDLDGRVELILDGGSCGVGVESTVVDGLCEPPVVLRPGGVSLEELRGVPGWEGVVKGYRDESEEGGKKEGGGPGPRAPGMKYKHYSPRAKVVLFEAKGGKGSADDVLVEVKGRRDERGGVVGIIRTLKWQKLPGDEAAREEAVVEDAAVNGNTDLGYEISRSVIDGVEILDIGLGQDTKLVAQGLFSALRELDRKGADVIYVEGVEDGEDIAAAVMNRLRKAASEIRA
ncbi:translation factor [Cryphonectria parasitica EP155]|uniref:Threonylcarbamoyl-AMP synthase n=1 Tax=Cryphonectria parasitica (strain ATCC 38755 / EP155) TaxID=660469 RepID=A0A9P5CKS7_CRYP1|nr:translation factor [Cryphonectria parasitica EP155]KAF3762574.1 translation factor [Cryphonectria parasitica EP155]